MLLGPKEAHGDGRFVLADADFTSAYLETAKKGLLKAKVEAALSLLGPPCRLCPCRCQGSDRAAGKFGACGIGRKAAVSSHGPHRGEEAVLSGAKGSGTIFFTGCSLRCAFCQNADISRSGRGDALDPAELAGVMVRLQKMGCHNVNLVSPSHVAGQIVEALPLAVEAGLNIPLVYNTGGYDSLETLAALDGLIDVYMPDFKFWDERACGRWLGAPDYPSVARRAIVEMRRQVGDLKVGPDGMARRGVLARHLVMPGMTEDGARVVGWLAGLSRDMYVNVMGQYRPAGSVGGDGRCEQFDRRVRREETDAVKAAAVRAGLWRFAD
ncbi:MAG: radical SAM protein [Elusimicrobiota bacterium]|jgi:putative pyruvate formate lyase activating enzyme